MNQRALILATLCFTLIVGGLFGYAEWKKRTLEVVEPNLFVDVPVDETEEMRINAVHFFNDGTHTLVGEMLMPTPCDLLETDAQVAESMPEQVTVAFTTINNADSCAQVLTPARFRVDFEASREATISATYNGRPAILNVRDAADGETLEEMGDIYFKG